MWKPLTAGLPADVQALLPVNIGYSADGPAAPAAHAQDAEDGMEIGDAPAIRPAEPEDAGKIDRGQRPSSSAGDATTLDRADRDARQPETKSGREQAKDGKTGKFEQEP